MRERSDVDDLDERVPWADPAAADELRDEADDLEDALIDEMRERGAIDVL